MSGMPINEMKDHFGTSEDTIYRLRDDYDLPMSEERGAVRTRKCCPACGSVKVAKGKKAKLYKCELCGHESRNPATKQMGVKRFMLPKALEEKQMQEAV